LAGKPRFALFPTNTVTNHILKATKYKTWAAFEASVSA
jgi:hypothetical protein